MPQTWVSASLSKEAMFLAALGCTIHSLRAALPLKGPGVPITQSLSKPGRSSKASTVLGLHFFEGLISLLSLPPSLKRWLFGLLLSLIVDDI